MSVKAKNEHLSVPDLAEKMYQQALLKNEQGLLVEASTLLTQAISMNNQQPQYFHQRGIGFFAMGESDQGIKDFNRAVALKTTELSVYLKLINHYLDHQQYMAALSVIDQLIANLPEQAAGAYFDKGRVYRLMGQPQLALAAYQMALKHLDQSQHDFKKVLQSTIRELKQTGE